MKTNKTPYTDNSKIYNINDIDYIIENAVHDYDLRATKKGIKYYNIPCAFDIETTSFYRTFDGQTFRYKDVDKKWLKTAKNVEKIAIMWVWQFGINGFCIVGRTWNEFLTLCNRLKFWLNLDENKRLIVYVHNLAFEFQFIRKYFEWINVFSLDLRKPIYAVATLGIEFRCSYLLSGYNLNHVAKNLQRHKINKLIGNLEYDLLRHSQTAITDKEMQYCINDIKIVMLYILEYIENVKNICHIPLTKTGAVRKFCRKECFTKKIEKTVKNWNYINFIKNLTITDLQEFNALQRAFSGGFTHANASYVDNTVENVASYDFTSSYPAVMVSEMYPISRGCKYNIKNNVEFREMLKDYLSVFDIEFNNIFAIKDECYISVSKCFIKENIAENNGRLVAAKRIVLTITNVDFRIIEKLYKFDNYRIGFAYIYKKGYLPTEFIKAILQLYSKKTELKGVDGMETEYLNSKEMLNSCYGMCVTNPLRNEFKYENNGVWSEIEKTIIEKNETLYNYNNDKKRFLYYIWGVFVTAYARKNLFTAITLIGNDYVYSDTDSVKILNYEKHKTYFETYNKMQINKLKKACEFHKINYSLCSPKTVKGKEKILGIWDFEGIYEKFKTLGAKRYMVKAPNILNVDGKNYNYSLTVSGVNKFSAIPYLTANYNGDEIFNAFTNYLSIPDIGTGKMIHTYIDYEINGKLTDYNGITADFNAVSGVHLEPTEYSLNLSVNFLNYLKGIKNY